jgi:Ca2+-binding RTX toxin-like protein
VTIGGPDVDASGPFFHVAHEHSSIYASSAKFRGGGAHRDRRRVRLGLPRDEAGVSMTFGLGQAHALLVVLGTAVAQLLSGPGQAESAPTPFCFGEAATIVGTEGDDLLEGTSGEDVIVTLGGDDTVYGYGGRDRICAAYPGTKTLFGDAPDPGSNGRDGRDLILGGPEGDFINGGRGEDRIWGLGEDDRIEGAGGDDYLHGGPGEDFVDGGPGIDTCVRANVIVRCEIE